MLKSQNLEPVFQTKSQFVKKRVKEAYYSLYVS